MSKIDDLIFIDETLSNIPAIIDNLPENSKWFKINSLTDGIQQIENVTKNYQNLYSIQIVSHGNSGSLSIGSASLSNQNIASYQTNFANIGNSLVKGGDLLIYACNVAADEDGKKLVTGIAEYTLADVAASIDLTGPTLLGGNSVLEFQTGKVTTPIINANTLSEALWSDNNIESDITTKALEDKLKEYNNDGTYTYLEMRTLLETAAQGGISADEYSDLKKAYQKIEAAKAFETDPVGSDSYVQYITYSAIHTHAANAKWSGGVTLKKDVQSLGNMHAGMSQDKATKLVKKWFYGEDLPMPYAGGDTANPSLSPKLKIGEYVTSTGPMFKADVDLTNSSTTAGVLVTADDMSQGKQALVGY